MASLNPHSYPHPTHLTYVQDDFGFNTVVYFSFSFVPEGCVHVSR